MSIEDKPSCPWWKSCVGQSRLCSWVLNRKKTGEEGRRTKMYDSSCVVTALTHMSSSISPMFRISLKIEQIKVVELFLNSGSSRFTRG